MIEQVFKKLDHWRHLPGYQLERRADIFFGCYLREILEGNPQFKGSGIKFNETIIPEFPLLIKGSKNLSNNIDYAAFSEDGGHVVFVELKTDERSFSLKQLEYLVRAKQVDFVDIVQNMVSVFNASKTAKRKHFRLLESLECLGLLEISPKMKEIFDNPHGDLHKLRSLSDCDRTVKILKEKMPQQIHVYYLKPSSTFNRNLNPIVHELVEEHGVKIISFDDVKGILLAMSGDSFARRFASSIENWSSIKPGGEAMVKV